MTDFTDADATEESTDSDPGRAILTTIADVLAMISGWGPIASAALKFLVDAVQRWLDGDRSEDVRRVIDTLPLKLRSRLELEYQRRQAQKVARDAAQSLSAR